MINEAFAKVLKRLRTKKNLNQEAFGFECEIHKSKDRKTYAFLEEDLSDYNPDELEWRWTTETKTGLQGIKKRMDFVFSDGIPIKNNFLKDLFSRKTRTFFRLNPSDCQLMRLSICCWINSTTPPNIFGERLHQ